MTVFVADIAIMGVVVVWIAPGPDKLFTKLLFGTELLIVAICLVGGSSPGRTTVVFFFLSGPTESKVSLLDTKLPMEVNSVPSLA